MTDKHQTGADLIREQFKGIWSLENLDEPNLKEVIQKAIADPSKYVIKPQKEGGGHNFYGREIHQMLTSPDQQEYLKQFLIMERIFPPEIKAQMLRRGKLTVTETHSEIGIYSSVFVDISKSEDYILENKTYGRLLRTKGTESDEGGINTGFSVIDQPFLIEVGDLRTSKI